MPGLSDLSSRRVFQRSAVQGAASNVHEVWKGMMATPRFVPPLVIVASAVVLALPCLLVGIPGHGDSFTHVMYQYYFSRQLWAGDLYPRWLAEANKGYGSPMFLFQYPLPYYLTALLRPGLAFAPNAMREGHELGVFCSLTLAGSGLAAWVWFRQRCTPAAATIAALAYISLPYLLGQVLYTRAAIGELATFPWMALILALCDHIQKRRVEIVCAIALGFALLIVSNVMYAVMFAPIAVLYAMAAADNRTSAALRIIVALLLGVGVSGLYIVPFFDYKKFLDLTAIAKYDHLAELGRNLLYFTPNEKLTDTHNGLVVILTFTWTLCLMLFVAWYIWRLRQGIAVRLGLLSVLGLGVVLFVPGMGPELIKLAHLKVSGFETYESYPLKMLITALLVLGLGLLSYCRILGHRAGPREHVLMATACGAFLLMLPWAAGLWSAVPAASVIQYPWRLCSFLSVAVSGVLAIALDDCIRHGSADRKLPSTAGIILFTMMVIIGGNAIWRIDVVLRSPTTAAVDTARWVEAPFVTFVNPPALSNFAARLGTSPYSYVVAPTPVENGVNATCEGGGGSASVVRASSRKLLVAAHCPEQSAIEIGQLYFPLWRVASDNRSDAALTVHSSADGLIEVSSPTGKSDFELVFDGGLAEKAGLAISVFSIAIVFAGFARAALRRRPGQWHNG